MFGLCSIPGGGGLGVAVAWPQAGGEGIAFGICWIGGGKDVGVEFMCAASMEFKFTPSDNATVISVRCLALVASDCFGSTAGCALLLDEGCIGLESSGPRAGCASLVEVLGVLSGVNGSACGGFGMAVVGRVG